MNNDYCQYPKRSALLSIVLLIAGATCSVFSQDTSFTYQGRLQDGGTNANGSYDFQFTLWDSLSGGTQQPQPSPVIVTRPGIAVVNGTFTVQLDFGASAFPGANRFLEISVKPTSGGTYTALSPRQAITSTPYAVRSASAGNADVAATANNATQLGGVPANNYLQTVTTSLSLTGNGKSGSPLGVSVPLQLTGNFGGQGIISGINTNSAGAGVYGRSNLTNSGSSFSAGVFGENVGKGNGVYGTTNNDNDSFAGVHGSAPNGDGVLGEGGHTGVFGFSQTGTGVFGSSGGDSGAGVSAFNSSNTGSAVSGFTTNGKAIFGQSTNGFAGFFDGKSYFGGTVGIGTQTPSSNLHLLSSSTTSFAIQMENTSTTKRLFIGNYGTVGVGSHWPGLASANTSFMFAENPLVFSTFGGIFFSGSGTAEHLHINSGGTVNVAGSLVAGTTGIPIVFGAPPNLKFVTIGGAAILGNSLFSTNGTNGVRITPASDTDLGVFNVTNAANSLNWLVVGNNGQVLMNGSGNVGIGTPSPTSKLQVNGQGRFSTVNIDSYVSGQNLSLCTASSGANQNIIGLCSSSLRYKTNVQSFRKGLDIVMRLQPISFDWKDAGTHDVGLAAEQVERIEPLLTFRNDKGQVEGVKYNQLSALFINAFKEQQVQIQQQEEQLKRQQEQINRQQELARRQRVAFASQQQQLNALKKLVCRSNRRAAVCR